MRVGRAIIRRHKAKYFVCDFGRIAGVRLRLHKRTASEAIRLASQKTTELNNYGKLARTMCEKQRVEAATCFERLKEVGASMTEAVSFFIKRHPLGGMKRTIEEVINELVSKKRTGGRRTRYVDDFEWKLNSFAKNFPGKRISAFTPEDIEAVIKKHPDWAARTVHSYVQCYKVLFYYAMRRGYSVDNPCLKLEMPIMEDREPVISTVADVQRALAVAKTSGFYDCTPYISIGYFSGIRPNEIDALQWEQVDFENKTLTVLTASAKGRARRIVDMSENLIAWLLPYREPSGSVLAVSVRTLRMQMRSAMGLDRWPQNVMRHSFASYHFAHHRNEALLKQLMGHGDDGRILHNHYRALVQPNDAKAFWAIFPPSGHTK